MREDIREIMDRERWDGRNGELREGIGERRNRRERREK